MAVGTDIAAAVIDIVVFSGIRAAVRAAGKACTGGGYGDATVATGFKVASVGQRLRALRERARISERIGESAGGSMAARLRRW